jgi:hypothetical protein
MRRWFLLFLVFSQNLSANPFSLGFILGDPSGISAKYDLTERTAIDGGVGFSYGWWGGRSFHLYGDHLWFFPNAFQGKGEFPSQIVPYVGAGGILFISTSDSWNRKHYRYYRDDRSVINLGFRVPLGLYWKIKDAPVSIYLEITPGISLIPDSYGLIQGGIGARYHF